MAALKTSRQKFMGRSLFVLVMLCVVGLGICVCSLVYVQLIKGGEFREKAANNQLHDTVVAAERGVIYDANMTPLAESTSVKKVYVNAALIGNNTEVRDIIVKNLSEILGLSEDTVRAKCSQTGYRYVIIKSKVESDTVKKVNDFMNTYIEQPDKEGKMKKVFFSYYVGIDPDVKRYYSKPYLASSVLGFTGADDEGLYGIELKYNSVLTGVPGRIITAQNGGVNSQSMPIEYKNVYDAKQGTSLVLTIDEYIQSYLENALEQAYVDTHCSSVLGIIMDVDTGAVLGMGSRGGGYYDLEHYDTLADERLLERAIKETEAEEAAKREKAAAKAAENGTADTTEVTEVPEKTEEQKRKENLKKALSYQWQNLCVTGAYEPGSVFKVFTASALLEEGLVTMDETYTCTGSAHVAGSLYNCHRHSGHGTQNITKALMNSCNPFFITRGVRLGVENFNRYVEAFGFLERTGIDLADEANSIYYDRSRMTMSNVASASFGQSFQITPIQMVTAISCIGNGGKLMRPYLVAKQLDADGNIVAETKPTVKRQVISKETAEKVRSMMESVVCEGTGKNAYVAGYRVAGKTGTSEKLTTGSTEYWASFACLAPANDPEIAMILVIDNPEGAHGGGAVAAPVASGIIESVMQYLNVEPQYTEKELEDMEVIARDSVGQSVSDAREAFLSDGFTVKVKGDGDTVLSQIPSGGQSVPKKGAIILYTSEAATAEKAEMPDLVGYTVNEATNKALAAGINIRIAGNVQMGSELVSYKQSVEAGSTVSYGTAVTVYFKSNMGIVDA